MSDFRCKGGMYFRNEVGFGVLHIPQNKRPCLCTQVRNEITPCASFSSEKSAQVFLDTFEKWIEGYPLVTMD